MLRLLPLIEAVPLHQRIGAIIKGEHGLPVRARSYYNWFKDIAEPAGIPAEVWNMDARAGGATEAEEAGIDIGLISEGLTHTNTKTSGRYIRRRSKKIVTIAEARKQSRAGGEGGGNAGG